MRGPLRGHLFVRARGPRRRYNGLPSVNPSTKLTTQMIVMTCFFEEGREERGENTATEERGEQGMARCKRFPSTCYSRVNPRRLQTFSACAT